MQIGASCRLTLSIVLAATTFGTVGARTSRAQTAPPAQRPAQPAAQPSAPAPTRQDEPDSDAAPTTPRSDEPRFAPPPNLEKNPIDVLPGDVVYPPIRDTLAPPVIWSPEWARFSTADWIITGAGTAIAIAAAIVPPIRKGSFSGGIGFDDAVRDTIRARTPEGRYVARDGSDIILSLSATWPFFVDALITTWWYRRSPDAAAQMSLVNGQALAIVTALQGVTNTIVSRERPYGQLCGTEEQPAETNDCESNTHYRSFFSGHSAFTFMSAGLICVHHQKLSLLQGAGDDVACVLGYTGAAATATLRVVSDVHYASDVLVGATVGTLVGLAVPLLHYRRVNLAPREMNNGVDVTVIPVGAGLGVGGTF